MHYLEQFQLNVYALVVLVILLVVISTRLRVQSYGKKLLYAVIGITMAAIITDPLTWMFDGTHFVGSYFLEYSTNFLNLLYAPIISSLMLSYVRYRLLGKHVPIWKDLARFIPFWVTLIILIINLIEPIYFQIDTNTNSYSAGPYLALHYVMIGLIYLYMSYITVRYGRKQHKQEIAIFLVFFLLPIVGMTVQIIDEHIQYSWNFIALSILVIFLFLESADGELDFLTKLFNRRSYENYVSQLIERNKAFQVVYIDLDKFKNINDIHGHLSGDKVLIEFARIIEQVFTNRSMLARLGGDEYMIVIEHKIDIEQTVVAIREAVKQGSDFVKELNFSYGFQRYEPGMTVDELYAAVDAKMYQYKRANNNLRRRRSDD